MVMNRFSRSLAFQAFHTFGLVPRMSATVSRYSAVSRYSSLTMLENHSMTAGSDKSDFCAVLDITRCDSTSHATRLLSALLRPCALQNLRASMVPNVEWSPPRPLAMSWNNAAR